MKIKLLKPHPDLPGSKTGEVLNVPDQYAIQFAKDGYAEIVEVHAPNAEEAKRLAGQKPNATQVPVPDEKVTTK